MNALKNDIINRILDKLEDLRDCDEKFYGCDLAYSLFESENVDGTATYSTYEAQEWIKEYFDEIGDVVEEIKFSLGAENIYNPFTQAEVFMVTIILEGASYILSQCELIDQNWNDEFVLTNENIDILINELNASNKTIEFYK